MTANAQVYKLLKNIECRKSQVMAAVANVRVSQALQSSFTDSANTLAKLNCLCSQTRQASSRNGMLLPSRRTERGAAEEVAEAGEVEATGAVVVVEAGREVAPMVVWTFLT